ncbi:hypothetical protein OF83DRAFT_1170526 [Amylostereum chailletii]|nr:hypothetical protein OF83DRAFT_1170526 [Amylostereum chailletii]
MKSKPLQSRSDKFSMAKSGLKYRNLGDRAVGRGDYEEALDLYTYSLTFDDSHLATFLKRAAAYIQTGRHALALRDCKLVITLQEGPPSCGLLVRVGRCQYALGQTTAALASLREALFLQPDNAIALSFQLKTLKLRSHIRDFEGAKLKKHWTTAQKALEECIRMVEAEQGEIPIEWKCWGIELMIARGEWDKGMVDVQKALRVHTLSSELMILRATLLLLTGQLDESIMELRKIDPDNLQAKSLLGRVTVVEKLKKEGNQLYATSKWIDAIMKYNECLEVLGEKPEEGKGSLIRVILLSNRGFAHVKLGQYREAMADATAAMSISPKWRKALRIRSHVHIYNGNYDAALKDLELARDNAPTKAERRPIEQAILEAKRLMKEKRNEKDHYWILGISRTCTKVELKKAYMRESRKHHPDKGGNEDKFKLVATAYGVLSDPNERRIYDLQNPL